MADHGGAPLLDAGPGIYTAAQAQEHAAAIAKLEAEREPVREYRPASVSPLDHEVVAQIAAQVAG